MRTVRMLLASTLAALCLSLGLMVVVPAPASACSCVGLSPAQAVRGAEVVVAGTLVEAPGGSFHPDQVAWTFAVDTVYKGRSGTELTVASEGSGASCGLEGMDEGTRYVVFAVDHDIMGKSTSTLWAHLCGGTAEAGDRLVDAVEQEAGTGQPPDPAAVDPGADLAAPSWDLSPQDWLALGVVGLGVLLLGGVLALSGSARAS